MENLDCHWALTGKNNINQGKRVIFASCRKETVPCSREIFPLEAQILENGDKTFSALQKDYENLLLADPQTRKAPLHEGCLCNKPRS